MSEVDKVEKIFKAVQAFPNDIRIASLAQECIAIVSHLERQLKEAREAMCIYVREHVGNEEIETDEQAIIYFKNTFNEKNYN